MFNDCVEIEALQACFRSYNDEWIADITGSCSAASRLPLFTFL